MAAAPAHDRGVERLGLHHLGRAPAIGLLVVLALDLLDAAAEADVIEHLRPLEFPGIARRQPVLRRLGLPAVVDHLPEQAMVVTDAIAVGGHPQAGHALHETGREPPQAAIAERRVRFDLHQPIVVDAQLRQR